MNTNTVAHYVREPSLEWSVFEVMLSFDLTSKSRHSVSYSPSKPFAFQSGPSSVAPLSGMAWRLCRSSTTLSIQNMVQSSLHVRYGIL